MRRQLLRTSSLVLVLLGGAGFSAGFAVAQQPPPAAEPQQQQQQEKAQQTPSGQMGKEEPSSHAPSPKPADNSVFVNGALAVPGAPENADTVPAKFSAKNAADDKLITLAYTFKLLTSEQRRAIYDGLKGQPAGPAFNAGRRRRVALLDRAASRAERCRCARPTDQGLSLRSSRQSRPAGGSGGPVRRGRLYGRRPSTESERRRSHAVALPVPRTAHTYTQKARRQICSSCARSR